MDDISTRSIALSRKELYILINAMENEVEFAEEGDIINELEENSERYDDASEMLDRLQELLGE
jgi:hypothetical protein